MGCKPCQAKAAAASAAKAAAEQTVWVKNVETGKMVKVLRSEIVTEDGKTKVLKDVFKDL